MTSESAESEIPQEKDSWESLAENLFGIEFGNASDGGEPIETGELSPLPDLTSVEPVEEPLVHDKEDSEAKDESPESSETNVVFSEESQEEIIDPPPRDEPTAATSQGKDDSYWDALKEWQWDDQGKSRPERKSDTAGPAQRREPTSASTDPVTSRSVVDDTQVESVSDLRNEYVADSDFGAGLLPQAEPTVENKQTESESPLSDSVAEEEAESQSRPKRRRRRRKSPKEESSTEKDVPTTQTEGITESQEITAGEDSFGDGIEVTESETDEQKTDSARRPRRRRPPRRRRRSRPDTETQSEEESKTEEETTKIQELVDEDVNDEDVSDEASDSDDDSTTGRQASNRKISTWEEAISHLLDHNRNLDLAAKSRGETKTASGNRGSKRRSSRSSSGRSSGRRGRRKGPEK